MKRRDFIAVGGLLLGSLPQAGRRVFAAPPLTSRLILLGTAGGPTPKKTRAYPGQIIVVGDRGYVIDCGNGIARQMALAGVFESLRHIFITHHHSDHNADLGNLILLEWGTNLKTPIDAWGPPPLSRMMRLFFEMNAEDLDVRVKDEGRPPLPPLVHAHEIDRGGAVMKDDRVTVTCAVVPHPMIPLALAYRFDCPDRSIVISGDTHQSDRMVALARGADVLVHEALYVPKAPGEPGSALRTSGWRRPDPISPDKSSWRTIYSKFRYNPGAWSQCPGVISWPACVRLPPQPRRSGRRGPPARPRYSRFRS